MINVLSFLSALGFFISIYALYVEHMARKNKEYKAVCDINNKVSCTKAFLSSYGKTFGISNSLYGLIFYTGVFFLALAGKNQIIFYISIFSLVGSIYLAGVQYFKLKAMCIVCGLIYVINLLIFIRSHQLI